MRKQAQDTEPFEIGDYRFEIEYVRMHPRWCCHTDGGGVIVISELANGWYKWEFYLGEDDYNPTMTSSEYYTPISAAEDAVEWLTLGSESNRKAMRKVSRGDFVELDGTDVEYRNHIIHTYGFSSMNNYEYEDWTYEIESPDGVVYIAPDDAYRTEDDAISAAEWEVDDIINDSIRQMMLGKKASVKKRAGAVSIDLAKVSDEDLDAIQKIVERSGDYYAVECLESERANRASGLMDEWDAFYLYSEMEDEMVDMDVWNETPYDQREQLVEESVRRFIDEYDGKVDWPKFLDCLTAENFHTPRMVFERELGSKMYAARAIGSYRGYKVSERNGEVIVSKDGGTPIKVNGFYLDFAKTKVEAAHRFIDDLMADSRYAMKLLAMSNKGRNMRKTAFAATFDDAKTMMYEIIAAAENFEPWPMYPEGSFFESALDGVWLLEFWLDGDWKHDHLAFDEQVEELYPFLLNKGRRVVEEDGSDCYAAIHQFAFAGKDINLNVMADLFAKRNASRHHRTGRKL